jgi:hypothetical protein
MPDYPSRVHAGTVKAVFERRTDLYSVRETADAVPDGAVAVIPDDAASFAVYEGAPPRHRDAKDVGPVYSNGPDGPLAVPTGRVFVRFASGIHAAERREQFEAAGFEIDKTLSYAPNAVWLRPAAGGVARALPGLGVLGNLPGVEHVEPQLLFERGLKR